MYLSMTLFRKAGGNCVEHSPDFILLEGLPGGHRFEQAMGVYKRIWEKKNARYVYVGRTRVFGLQYFDVSDGDEAWILMNKRVSPTRARARKQPSKDEQRERNNEHRKCNCNRGRNCKAESKKYMVQAPRPRNQKKEESKEIETNLIKNVDVASTQPIVSPR